jgi:uncharacterized membrane protein YjjP (DUF1212 family)
MSIFFRVVAKLLEFNWVDGRFKWEKPKGNFYLSQAKNEGVTNRKIQDYDLLGQLLLEVGIAMIHAGAPTRRINLVLLRISAAFGCQIHHQLSTRHLSVSLYTESRCVFNGVVSSPSLPSVNFQLVSDISDLSLKVKEEKPTLAHLSENFRNLSATSNYARIVVLTVVSLAGSAFCFTFGGSLMA